MNTGFAPRCPRVIPAIVQQHVDEAVSLHSIRSALLSAPHVRLRHLRNFDDRLTANLEGLQIAGGAAKPMCEAALENPSASAVFVATIRALESLDQIWLQQLLALSESAGSGRSGLMGAFGWTAKTKLQGLVAGFLDSGRALERLLGLVTCSLHRVDPKLVLPRRLEDAEPSVRARAFRLSGELGKREFVSRLAVATQDEDPSCQFWAAWSAALLGDRQSALEMLAHYARQPGPFRARALQLAIPAMSVGAGHALLKSIAQDPAGTRQVVRGAGLAGDPAYVPWLISLMANDSLARLAGEAFGLIMGPAAPWPDLERLRPEKFESGPNDDPDDPNVDMDEDDGLPWPDAAKIQAWWHANSNRFQPAARYFMGEPLNHDNCVRVLKEGFQRQRIAAALHLSLLNPGTPLFEWRAPVWRQQRLLAEMV